MNAVTQRSGAGLPAALQSLRAGLQNVQSTIVISGGDPFLRLGKDGIWVYGADNTEVEEGSLWAFNPASLKHGWIAWKDSQPIGEVMVASTSPLPPEHELRDVGAKWDQQLSIIAMCLSGEDTGKQVLYKTTSHGGMSELKELIGVIATQLDKGTENIVPVAYLESSHYQHPKWGKTYTPIFNIQKWVPLSNDMPTELDDESSVAEEAAPAPEPAKPARRRAASVTATPAAPAATAGAQMTRAATQEEMAAIEAAARRQALLDELAKLDGGGNTATVAATSAPAASPAPGTTIRRRTRG